MAWTAPSTWTAATVTAAQLNAQIRDNLLETMPALASTAGGYHVVDATNSLAERRTSTQRIQAREKTASVTYVNLNTYGPEVSLGTGTSAMVIWNGHLNNDTASAQAVMSYQVTGATSDTTTAALDARGLIYDGAGAGVPDQPWAFGMVDHHTALTAGTNVFTCKYRAGGSGTGIFGTRMLAIMPF